MDKMEKLNDYVFYLFLILVASGALFTSFWLLVLAFSLMIIWMILILIYWFWNE